MSKMKTFLEYTAERIAQIQNQDVEAVQDHMLRMLGGEGAETYPSKLAYMETLEQLHPASANPMNQRILAKVIKDGWCLETESVSHPMQCALLKTYGLVDILGYEVMAVVPLSEGVNDTVWVDKLKSDINLLVLEQGGENRSETESHSTGLQGQLDLHFTTLRSRSKLGCEDGTSLSNYTVTHGNMNRYADTSKDLFSRKENRPYTTRGATPSNPNSTRGAVEGKYRPEEIAKSAPLHYMDYVNESLKDVDPYDITLDAETQQAILEECRVNPHYYFMKVLRMADYSKTDVQGWRRTCALGLLKGKLDECTNRHYGDVLTVDTASPLRTCTTVPYRIWTRNSVRQGEWNLITFIVNHLVK